MQLVLALHARKGESNNRGGGDDGGNEQQHWPALFSVNPAWGSTLRNYEPKLKITIDASGIPQISDF
jgi:hypothetical protein